MAAPMYDVIVVGAGVVGSFTAYHLAKQGKRTLLLEQVGMTTMCRVQGKCARMESACQ